jgi:hypothetical protein
MEHTSICVFFSIIAMRDHELENFDVTTAFVHGKPKEKIYRTNLKNS